MIIEMIDVGKIVSLIVGLCSGLLLGGLIVWLIYRAKVAVLEAEKTI